MGHVQLLRSAALADTAPYAPATAVGDHDARSTLLGVTVLGYPDQLVEVEAVAARPSRP